ncbi:hypothetical protein HZA86_05025 [Candidatus Uhrbacteria bacterium]|nr:hypothetical protein [Candidatus Uhrbacteria bacterium]
MNHNGGDHLALAQAIMVECMGNNFTRFPMLKDLISRNKVRFTQLGIETATLNQWEFGWKEETEVEAELERERLRDQAKEFLYRGLQPYVGRHGETKARVGIKKIFQDFAGAARENRDKVAKFLKIHPAELQRILAGQ